MSEWTKGPYWIVGGDEAGFKTDSGGPSICARSGPDDDYFVMKLAELNGNTTPARRYADALLFAAAPTMAEALEECRFRWFGTGPSNSPLCKQIDAALALAKGEPRD